MRVGNNHQKNKYQYLFGPVPSRRFGRSLGVDLIPYKTCSLDCVFCQLGRTPQKTVDRKAYVPVESVISEIDDWMEKEGDADYITLAGSGEPTLHSDFGRVLAHLKDSTIPSALLTNGSTMNLQEVRNAAAHADVVKVSLSSWDQRSFEWVNRPHNKLQFNLIIEGLKKFRAQFTGELWMEVFMVLGINAMPKDVEKIAAFISEIKPDRIQLNTVVRPPAENFAAALSKMQLENLVTLFDPPAEVIAEFNSDSIKSTQVNEETILSMLKRRPCTIEQVSKVFGLHINESSKYLGKLMRDNYIYTVHKKTAVFYTAIIEKDKLRHVEKAF